MERKLVILEKKEGVGRITIDNQAKRNCLSQAVVIELLATLEELRQDKAIKAVTVTGAGDISFSAGMNVEDLRHYHDHPEAVASGSVVKLDEVIRNFPKVTIAAVNGYCLGAAITFLISHDLAIASEEKAQFGLPEVIRSFPPRNVVGALFRAIPMKPAFEMLLTGANWDARKAQAIGLVNRVVPHAELQEAAFQWAKDIIRWDPITLQYCKKMAHATMDQLTYTQALEVSGLYHTEHARMNPNAIKGLRDFIAKKGVKANF